MGIVGRIKKTALGGFIGAALLGLLGCCIYSSLYCSKNNPYQSYYPGRQGKIGTVSYVIAVTSIVSLVFFLISFVFNILDVCSMAKKILAIIGIVVYIACFIAEILFIVWNNWDLDKSINNLLLNKDDIKNYADIFRLSPIPLISYYDLDYDLFSGVIPGVSLMSIRSPPTFGKVNAFVDEDGIISKKEINMPVCYFSTLEDKLAFRPKKCIGKWDGEKIKNYIDELNKRIQEDIDRRDWSTNKRLKWHFNWNYNNIIMYSQPGSHALMLIFLGIQIAAIVCGLIYLILAAQKHFSNHNNQL